MELKKTPVPGSGACPAATGVHAVEIWQMLALSKVDVHQNKEMSQRCSLPQATLPMSGLILSGAQWPEIKISWIATLYYFPQTPLLALNVYNLYSKICLREILFRQVTLQAYQFWQYPFSAFLFQRIRVSNCHFLSCKNTCWSYYCQLLHCIAYWKCGDKLELSGNHVLYKYPDFSKLLTHTKSILYLHHINIYVPMHT